MAEPYRNACVPEFSNSGGMLPIPLSPGHSGVRNRPSYLPSPTTAKDKPASSTKGIRHKLKGIRDWFSSGSSGSVEPVISRDPGQPSASNVDNTGKIANLHWCVDRAWTEPQRTVMCSIPDIDSFEDDATLYRRLKREYFRKRGWLRTFFSWKTCTEVEFVEVSIRKRIVDTTPVS